MALAAAFGTEAVILGSRVIYIERRGGGLFAEPDGSEPRAAESHNEPESGR